MIRLMMLAFVLMTVVGIQPVLAAEKAPRVVYKKKTVINFDDSIIEGEIANPEGVYVVRPPEKKFGSLLKLRPHFHKELMRDALLLK